MKTLPFTQEQMESLKSNPYTACVSPRQIFFTLEFKLFALKEAQNGMKSVKIFQKAGYDPEVLGKERMYCVIKRIKKEAASEQGLHVSKGEKSRERLSKEMLEKKQTAATIKAMQKKILQLEQELEFLKKTASLRHSMK